MAEQSKQQVGERDQHGRRIFDVTLRMDEAVYAGLKGSWLVTSGQAEILSAELALPDLLSLLEDLADRWEERATKNAAVADTVPDGMPFRMGLVHGDVDATRRAASELRFTLTSIQGSKHD